MTSCSPDWREFGVRIVRHDQLDVGTRQTLGMHREAAVSRASAGAERLWAGPVTIQPGAKTGPHHHGPLERVIYVVRSDQEPVVVNLAVPEVSIPRSLSE